MDQCWAFIQTKNIDESHYWIGNKTLCGIDAKEEDNIIKHKGFVCKECEKLFNAK